MDNRPPKKKRETIPFHKATDALFRDIYSREFLESSIGLLDVDKTTKDYNEHRPEISIVVSKLVDYWCDLLTTPPFCGGGGDIYIYN